jgi:hypothetical protein
LRESYAAALDEYLRDRPEIALHAAYELGRDAARRKLSVLDLASMHHDVLLSALSRADAADPADTVTAAGEFFLESLAAFDTVEA